MPTVIDNTKTAPDDQATDQSTAPDAQANQGDAKPSGKGNVAFSPKGATKAQSPTDVQLSNEARIVKQYLQSHFDKMTKTKVFTETILKGAAGDLCMATEIICRTGDKQAMQAFLDYVKDNATGIMSSNNSQRGNLYLSDRRIADRMSAICELAYRNATNDKARLNVDVVRKFLNTHGKSEDIILFFAPNGN